MSGPHSYRPHIGGRKGLGSPGWGRWWFPQHDYRSTTHPEPVHNGWKTGRNTRISTAFRTVPTSPLDRGRSEPSELSEKRPRVGYKQNRKTQSRETGRLQFLMTPPTVIFTGRATGNWWVIFRHPSVRGVGGVAALTTPTPAPVREGRNYNSPVSENGPVNPVQRENRLRSRCYTVTRGRVSGSTPESHLGPSLGWTVSFVGGSPPTVVTPPRKRKKTFCI